MNVFIVDDEPNCTDVLKILLNKYCPEVTISGIFNDSVEALKEIIDHTPDLVLLDIEMPVMNGFDILNACPHLDFKVVFTTAYDKFAIKAFKFNTIDYLLKPIDKNELILAISKAESGLFYNKKQIQNLQYLRSTSSPERIALPIEKDLVFIEVADIIYCEADGSYSRIYLHSQAKPHLLSKSLREVEEFINNPHFFRAHASYLINLKFIKKISKSDGLEITMMNDAKLPLARSKKNDLLSFISKL